MSEVNVTVQTNYGVRKYSFEETDDWSFEVEGGALYIWHDGKVIGIFSPGNWAFVTTEDAE